MGSGSESSSQTSPPRPMRLCGFCHKPFLKENSYNRHVLYCRSTQNCPRTRARPCRACNMAKVKCNLQARCLRCTKKGLECVYDTARAISITTNENKVINDSEAKNMAQVSTLISLTDDGVAGISPDLDASSEAQDISETQVYKDWDALNFLADDAVSRSPMGGLSHFPESVLDDMPTEICLFGNRINGFNTDFDSQNLSLNDLCWPEHTGPKDKHLPTISQPTCLSERPTSNFLSPISISDPISNCTAKVIMHMLRAFPKMMLRRETLPPFIHGHWYRPSSATESALPKPLANCVGVAHIFASQNLETRPFLWRTIQMEQHSAADKSSQHQFSKHDLLSAIQAQLIYIIMRVIDDSKAEPGLNLEILAIYQNLCESFKNLCNQPFFQDERLYPSSSWEDWIFAESRRRTVIVWILITQMVHIKIGVPCDNFDGFRDIPLPAPKSLWEARTRSQWQLEYEVYQTMPRMGLELFGDLIDACKHSDIMSNKVKLDAWNSTIDNLGLLLNLGAAMV